jgi:hypothetical protein
MRLGWLWRMEHVLERGAGPLQNMLSRYSESPPQKKGS